MSQESIQLDNEHWVVYSETFDLQNHLPTETIRIAEKPAKTRSMHAKLPRMSVHTPFLESLPTAVELSMVEEDEELSPPEFRLGALLATGGMGRICQATQIPLHREVVIKMLRKDKRNAPMAARLLQEACLTGVLEHPNIVPIYQLGKDSEGHPMLVMKRIEGTDWKEVLQTRHHNPEKLPSEQRTLEWHIRILVQVCNAIEFAHSKKIVHRDIKPENVMIGEFGEIYMLDWGIAASIDPEESRPIPAIKDATGLAGTPSYMAPEMLASNLEQINERTDVYLLGAVLHEILTGAPPHSGHRLMEILAQICTRGNFDYGKSIPSGLADASNRAMSLLQDERFPSVKEFRLALEQYLTHREAYELIQESLKLLEELRGHLALISPQDTTLPAFYTPPEEVDTEIYAVFWRCHFGFKQALRIWEDSQEAKDGLQSLLEAMIEHELNQKDLKTADNLLAELPHPNPALSAWLESLRKKQEKKATQIKQFQQIEYERDAAISSDVRRWTTALGFGILSISCIVTFFLQQRGMAQFTHLSNLIAQIGAVAFVLIVGTYYRKELFINQFNRQIIKIFLLLFVTLIALRMFYMELSISITKAAIVDQLIFFSYCGLLSILIDGRMFIIAIGYLSTAVATYYWPSGTVLFLGIGHSITAFNITKIWNYGSEAST